MNAELLESAVEAREAGVPTVLVTNLGTGSQTLLRPTLDSNTSADSPVLMIRAREALLADRSCVLEHEGERLFLHVSATRVRVIVVGAVHIAQPLAVQLEATGYEVVVVDPRSAFASPERFPGVQLEVSWPKEALERLRLDHRTAVVTVTHDPKLDDPALHAALGSSAFYVGALGSRKTHAARTARLAEAGFSEADIARIHAPVGLDIGSRTPGEIAASVLAQIVQVLRAPDS